MTEGLPPPPSDPGSGSTQKHAPPEPTDDVAAYLRANNARYTREALDLKLLAAGYGPEAIDVAWAALDAPAREAPGAGVTLLTVLAILVVVVSYGISAVLGGLGAMFSANGGGPAAIVLPLYTIGVIGGGLWAIAMLWRRRSADNAVVAVLVGIGIAAGLYLLLSGICLATWQGISL